MTDNAKPCANCGRLDCPLLATVIVGIRAFVEAVADCYRAQRPQRR